MNWGLSKVIGGVCHGKLRRVAANRRGELHYTVSPIVGRHRILGRSFMSFTDCRNCSVVLCLRSAGGTIICRERGCVPFGKRRKAESVILLFHCRGGGAPHIDIREMKPDVTIDYCGPFELHSVSRCLAEHVPRRGALTRHTTISNDKFSVSV